MQQWDVDFDAICEVAPSVSQVSYEDLLAAMVGKTLVSVRVQNPVVSGSRCWCCVLSPVHWLYHFIDS